MTDSILVEVGHGPEFIRFREGWIFLLRRQRGANDLRKTMEPNEYGRSLDTKRIVIDCFLS